MTPYKDNAAEFFPSSFWSFARAPTRASGTVCSRSGVIHATSGDMSSSSDASTGPIGATNASAETFRPAIEISTDRVPNLGAEAAQRDYDEAQPGCRAGRHGAGPVDRAVLWRW